MNNGPRITAGDVRKIDDVEERGKMAMVYFRQSMPRGLEEQFGFIDAYVEFLEDKLSRIRVITQSRRRA